MWIPIESRYFTKMVQYTVVDNSSATHTKRSRRTSVPELPDLPLPNRLCISSRFKLQHFVTSHIAFGSDPVNMVPRNEASGNIRRRTPARPTAVTLVCYFFSPFFLRPRQNIDFSSARAPIKFSEKARLDRGTGTRQEMTSTSSSS